MAAGRLTLALDGHVTLPDTGRVALFAPRAGMDVSALPQERLRIYTGFKPDHDYFAGLGFECALQPEGRFAAAIVCLPRAKVQARALVALASAVTDGPVIIDGAKTDGVESILKDCRKRARVTPPFSKAHGKVFSLRGGDFTGWEAGARQRVEGGFVTAPGVFSADGIDPASRLLGDHLPKSLGAHVIDLGGGWGYLSARALERKDIKRLDLVEAEHAALDCARENLPDARAQLHWADALHWRGEAADTVIMNPPFHTARTPDPALGRGFITAAAGLLKPGGQLWLVANRHLPYEPVLNAQFAEVKEITGDNRFKVLNARRPLRRRS